MSALLEDLAERGLLDETLVVCCGEFGRSPQINRENGRGHHVRAFSAVVAGAGIAGGQVIGATCRAGIEVTDRPIAVAGLLRTITTLMGVDPDTLYETPQGRPVHLVDGGQPIEELLG
jgi:uncharacterized protein (DUF1501 family)